MAHPTIADSGPVAGADDIDALRTALARYGVVHVRDLIPPDEVELVRERMLRRHFDDAGSQVIERDGAGLTTEFGWLSEVDDTLSKSGLVAACGRLADELFGKPSSLGFDHAFLKAPGAGTLAWHQDLFYTPSPVVPRTLTFWVPLHDMNERNGRMEYILGPRELQPHSPVSDHSRYHHIRPELLPSESRFSPLLRAGDVCIHTPYTVHRSLPNTDTAPRASWTLQFHRNSVRRFFSWRQAKYKVSKIRTERARPA